jgi:hypothetical protein
MQLCATNSTKKKMADDVWRRIVFRLDGSRKDNGLVLAQDFVTFLENALGVLRRLERRQTGETRRTFVSYRIVDLEIGSALVELEAEAPEAVDVGFVFSRFAEAVVAYRDGNLASFDFDPRTAESFENMMAPLNRSVRAIHVGVGGLDIEVVADEGRSLRLTREVENATVGSISGFVDAVNVHSEPVFYLYPTVGPRVKCKFDRGILNDVRASLKRYTTAFGLLGYVEGNPYPVDIIVERVEVNPPAENLPTLRSMWGIAPELTGGLDSVSFVRQMRDASE